jgi:hypothetical protein
VQILYRVSEAVIETPDGTVREVIFPHVFSQAIKLFMELTAIFVTAQEIPGLGKACSLCRGDGTTGMIHVRDDE